MSKFPGGCQEHPKTQEERIKKIEADAFATHILFEQMEEWRREMEREIKHAFALLNYPR